MMYSLKQKTQPERDMRKQQTFKFQSGDIKVVVTSKSSCGNMTGWKGTVTENGKAFTVNHMNVLTADEAIQAAKKRFFNSFA